MAGKIVLRPYQQEAVDAIFTEWQQGHTKTLLALPTGSGKTTVFGEVARQCIEREQGVLVLAHRDELIRQAASRLSAMCGVPASIEKANEHYNSMTPLCVASVQTLQRDRLDEFPMRMFPNVIIDEAHHSIAGTYRNIIDRASAFGSRLLGVTATPDRADKRGLAEVYDSIAYEYKLEQAVKDGYLCPIRAKFVPLKLDISNVKVSHGDYQANDLGNALDPYIPAIARTMAQECEGRKTVCFLPLVATSEKMAEALNSAGLKAVSSSGYESMEERREKQAAFERGDYDVLCNSMLYTEGWDCPAVDCVVVLRPTKSRSLYSQMVGRGSRICEGKDHLLLLDFLWMTERHDLCRPATLLGRAPEVAQKAQEKLEDCAEGNPDGIDLMELEDEAENDVQREREESLAKQLESMRRRKAKLVDPLQYAVSICDSDLTNYQPTFAWEREKPTDKQLETLEKFQIDPSGVTTRGMASELLDACMKRIDGKLCTPRQLRILERYGFEHVGTWSKEQATYAIGRISSNGWKVPWDMRPGALEKSEAFASRAVA